MLVEAPGLRARLIPEGIVVRDCTSFGMPTTVRIAVPTPGGLERLDAALSSIDPCTVGEATDPAGASAARAGHSAHAREKGAP